MKYTLFLGLILGYAVPSFAVDTMIVPGQGVYQTYGNTTLAPNGTVYTNYGTYTQGSDGSHMIDFGSTQIVNVPISDD